MSQSKERKERLSGEERRAQIIDAALNLFAEKGFNGARTKEIAQRAGISETLIFQHFKTKEELYRVTLGELFSHHPVTTDIEENVAERDDFGVLSTIASHVISHNREDPRILRLALFSALEGLHFGESARHAEKARPTLPEIVSSYIQQRIDEGAFKKVNARIAGQLFIETIFMYVADQEASVTGPPLPYSDEEVIETLVRIFVEGLTT